MFMKTKTASYNFTLSMEIMKKQLKFRCDIKASAGSIEIRNFYLIFKIFIVSKKEA